MSTPVKRKLVAVLFSDIQGYTAMVQADEALALSRVNQHREVLENHTGRVGGRIVSFYGDGALVVYDSAVDAVSSAVAMQKAFIQADVPVRIGLHLGDVAFENESVFGDGVNVASRIQDAGSPGAVLISERLYQEVANHPQVSVEALGSFRLKNVKRPVKIFAISNDGLFVPAPRAFSPEMLRRAAMGILLTCILGLVGYLIWTSIGSEGEDGQLRSQRVAVRFHDFSNSSDNISLGAMASHWISNRLSDLPNTDIVSYDVATIDKEVAMATASGDLRQSFSKRTGAVNVIEGTIFRKGNLLYLDASLVNLRSGERLASFDLVECEFAEPMNCISTLSDKILGWWASRYDNPYSVPTYDAYEYYLSAREVWREDDDKAESNLILSIQSDSTFIDPYFLLTEFYIQAEDYQSRDSTIDLIKSRFDRLTSRQSDLLALYDAEVAGDLVRSYELYRSEIAADPTDLFVNTGGMVQAMLNVNRPKDALELFDMIDIDSLDLQNCTYCHTRIRLAALAHLRLAQYNDALEVAEKLPLSSARNIELLIKVLAANKDTAGINQVMSNAHRQGGYNMYEDFYPDVAWEFRLLAREDLVKWYCNQALANFDTINANSVSVECNYLLGNFNKVISLLDKTWPLDEFMEYEYVLSWTTRAYAQSGNEERVNRARRVLEDLDQQTIYDYGKYLYLRGVVEAISGNSTQAIDLLEHAYYSGTRFSDFMYNGDIDLIGIHGYTAYQSILSPLDYKDH